jgi:hypothetical protein
MVTMKPISDNLYPALAILRHAYDCAEDAHAAPLAFTLEIGFRRGGTCGAGGTTV